MSIAPFITLEREKTHGGLAAIDVEKLKRLRNENIKECFNHFEDINYRLEYVARIHNTEFINDAASRNPNASWYSLDLTEGPIIWIANGSEKEVNYHANLVELARKKVRVLYCVGDHTEQLHTAFEGVVPTVVDVQTIGEAVHQACYSDMEKKKVLYSPSVDSDIPTRQLGQMFRQEVNEL